MDEIEALSSLIRKYNGRFESPDDLHGKVSLLVVRERNNGLGRDTALPISVLWDEDNVTHIPIIYTQPVSHLGIEASFNMFLMMKISYNHERIIISHIYCIEGTSKKEIHPHSLSGGEMCTPLFGKEYTGWALDFVFAAVVQGLSRVNGGSVATANPLFLKECEECENADVLFGSCDDCGHEVCWDCVACSDLNYIICRACDK